MARTSLTSTKKKRDSKHPFCELHRGENAAGREKENLGKKIPLDQVKWPELSQRSAKQPRKSLFCIRLMERNEAFQKRALTVSFEHLQMRRLCKYYHQGPEMQKQKPITKWDTADLRVSEKRISNKGNRQQGIGMFSRSTPLIHEEQVDVSANAFNGVFSHGGCL